MKDRRTWWMWRTGGHGGCGGQEDMVDVEDRRTWGYGGQEDMGDMEDRRIWGYRGHEGICGDIREYGGICGDI